MKKIFAFLTTLILILNNVHTFAQKYGLQGGVNISNMIIKDNEATYSPHNQVGFNIGITIDYEISKLTELEAGIIYESRGAKDEMWELKMLYIDIPLLLKVGPTFGRVKICGAAGLYAGMGLGGLHYYYIKGKQQSEWFNCGKAEDALTKRLDYGAKFGITIQDVHLNMGIYYTLGIANISAIRFEGSKAQNRGFSICAGYRF